MAIPTPGYLPGPASRFAVSDTPPGVRQIRHTRDIGLDQDRYLLEGDHICALFAPDYRDPRSIKQQMWDFWARCCPQAAREKELAEMNSSQLMNMYGMGTAAAQNSLQGLSQMQASQAQLQEFQQVALQQHNNMLKANIERAYAKSLLDRPTKVCHDGVSLNSQPHPGSLETVDIEVDNVDKDVLPDISLTRALKWAVVALIALALGERVWRQFGGTLVANLEKTITGAAKELK